VSGFYPSEQQSFLVVNISLSSYTDGLISYPVQASGLCKEIETLQEQGSALLGKTILCLGDSITEFKYQGKRYSDYLAEITGATVINGGIGGSQMGRRTYIPTSLELENAGQAYACLDLPSLAEAISTGDFTAQTAAANWLAANANDDNTGIISTLEAVDISKVDIITIFIGTNDVGSPLGELGEVGNSSGTLNCSKGLQWAIQKLLTANPKLRIYYFCPMPRYFGDLREAWDDAKWCDNYEISGIKFIDMVDFQIELAKYYKIPVCDMYRTMGINQWNIKSIMDSSSGDGTHPYLGFRMIANKIASFIIANNNLND
jgi:lysophospholipase L1-like esterase